MTDEQILAIFKRAGEVAKVPYKYGHSDIGTILILAAKGEISYEDAIQQLAWLEIAYYEG